MPSSSRRATSSSLAAITASVAKAGALTAATSAWLLQGIVALAASPSPSNGAGGDPRSSGQGPGLVGDPLLAILVVAAIGVLALVATLAYVRATGGSRTTGRHR
jgi:hypothetical protein